MEEETQEKVEVENEVKLGGRAYVLRPLAIRPAREWRAEFAGLVDTVVMLMRSAVTKKLASPDDLAGLAEDLAPKLFGMVDKLIEMMFAYSPELRADREWLEEHATDEEAMQVIIKIIMLAFPFGAVAPILRQFGPKPNGTKKNSAAISG